MQRCTKLALAAGLSLLGTAAVATADDSGDCDRTVKLSGDEHATRTIRADLVRRGIVVVASAKCKLVRVAVTRNDPGAAATQPVHYRR